MQPVLKRDDCSWWSNYEPIRDPNEALSLLAAEGSSTEPTYLARCPENEQGVEWEIVRPWYREGSSGADTSGTDYFQLATTVVEALRRKDAVVPYVARYWGTSSRDPERLVVTEEAYREAHARVWVLVKQAEGLLVPGVHTDLSGTPVRTRFGREHFHYGRFFVDFRMPIEGTCRVFPEHGELIIY